MNSDMHRTPDQQPHDESIDHNGKRSPATALALRDCQYCAQPDNHGACDEQTEHLRSLLELAYPVLAVAPRAPRAVLVALIRPE
jgi:hypothetical protein